MNGIPVKPMSVVARPVNHITGIDKRCPECGEWRKLASEYYVNKKLKDGRYSECIPCTLKKSREYHHKKPSVNRRAAKRYRSRHPWDNQSTTRKLNQSMAGGINHSLKKGVKAGRRWELLVGYTVDQLRRHLENLFRRDMTWKNYGKKGWEIDHKKPLASFCFNCPEDKEFKAAWSLENLQPLWAIENQRKGAKMQWPQL